MMTSLDSGKIEADTRKLVTAIAGIAPDPARGFTRSDETSKCHLADGIARLRKLHKRHSARSSFATGLLTLLLIGATACNRATAAQSDNTATSQQAVHVETQLVSARAVQVWLPLTGQLKGSRETDLAANASGRVVKTLVERGDVVKAGQPLVLLDTRAAALTLSEVRASAESARASAETAQTNCARYNALLDKGAISQAEYDRISVGCRTSELTVAAAQARAALAAQTLGDGVIRAPFAGSVAERFVDVGEYVRAESKVVTLVDFSTLRLEFTIPEADISVAKPGTRVRFTVAGYPDHQFGGVLKYIGAQVRPTTRDLVAEALVDAPDVALRPGMFASVQLAAGTTSQPVIPRLSLCEKDGRKILFVQVDGRLEERIVQPGETLGEQVAIARGINVGEKVVLAPNDKLKNGQRTL